MGNPYRISNFCEKLSSPSGGRSIMRDAQDAINSDSNQNWINLSIGNPRIFPEVTSELEKHAVNFIGTNSFTRTIGKYGQSRGYLDFIVAVVNLFNKTYNWNISAQNVLVTAGCLNALFISLNSLCGTMPDKSKSKILLPNCPEYTGYGGVFIEEGTFISIEPNVIKLSDHLFEYDYDFRSDELPSVVNGILLSRPCNPSGKVIRKSKMDDLLNWAKKNSIPVLIDNAYGPPFPNICFSDIAPIYDEHIINLFSFSKIGLAGERLGVIIAPEHFIARMEIIQSNIIAHSSMFGQVLASNFIKSGRYNHLIKEHITPFYQRNFKLVYDILKNDIPNISWYLHKSEGGIFAWLWFENLPVTDIELYKRLKEQFVLVAPGSSFFIGMSSKKKHYNECIRISLSASSAEINSGIKRLAKLIYKIYYI